LFSKLTGFFKGKGGAWTIAGLAGAGLVYALILLAATRTQNTRLSQDKALAASANQELKEEAAVLRNAVLSADLLAEKLKADARKRPSVLPGTKEVKAEALEVGEVATHAGLNISKAWVDEADGCLSEKEAWSLERGTLTGALNSAELDVDVARRKKGFWKALAPIGTFVGAGLGLWVGYKLGKNSR
jgi:hypothetical protein